MFVDVFVVESFGSVKRGASERGTWPGCVAIQAANMPFHTVHTLVNDINEQCAVDVLRGVWAQK